VRTDASLRLSAGGAEATGVRGTLDVASSSWTGDSTVPDRHLRLASASVEFGGSRGTAQLLGRAGDGPERRLGLARLGWSPVPGVLLLGEASLHGFSAKRAGHAWRAALGLTRGPLSLTGEVAAAELPQAPMLASDTAQRTVDRSVRAAVDTRMLSLRLTLAERDSFRPRPFGDLRAVPASNPTPASVYLVAEWRLQPISALALSGWYAHPRSGSADFQPPHHTRTQLTFRSKFWRTFRSGAFDLKVQWAVESWSAGRAGRTAAGTPIALPGLTFSEAEISFQLVGFTGFWSLRNALNTRSAFVPGMPDYPLNGQTFGVKWRFAN
jgi:hypothetical protein